MRCQFVPGIWCLLCLLTFGPAYSAPMHGPIPQPVIPLNAKQLQRCNGRWLGDSNDDGFFNSSDLVAVFRAGEFEDGIVGNSNWGTGDWDNDTEFGTSDLVRAFRDNPPGTFESAFSSGALPMAYYKGKGRATLKIANVSPPLNGFSIQLAPNPRNEERVAGFGSHRDDWACEVTAFDQNLLVGDQLDVLGNVFGYTDSMDSVANSWVFTDTGVSLINGSTGAVEVEFELFYELAGVREILAEEFSGNLDVRVGLMTQGVEIVGMEPVPLSFALDSDEPIVPEDTPLLYRFRVDRGMTGTVKLFAAATGTVRVPGRLTPNASFQNGAVTVIYDPFSGNVSVDTGGNGVTTFQITSLNDNLIPENITEGTLLPPFDLITQGKLFKLDVDGFGNINFGNILPPGLFDFELLDDLRVSGSFAGGGDLSRDVATSPHLFVIPEPVSGALLRWGCLFGLFLSRRRFKIKHE